ncbi:hypothetical protein [Bradyrhizobium sp. Tv2a-2]|uniref:hypothetical protein n=1 Tax=Bradyrhizobium sp. Tv2a-2 TaxID=113395 RepID=UPI0003FF0E8E|nr:hypothetical protein [Bradyrhizobium sp. Tv2a-2]
MANTAGYIAATIPAKKIRASGTTLFHVAMMQTGDPLQWVAIAELNGISDPWIDGEMEILIPPVFPSGQQDGILDAIRLSNAGVVTPLAPAQQAPASTTASPAMLSFDQSQDSQYLPLI